MLGVSQAAISYWENGRDIPNRRIVGRILDLIAGTAPDRFHVDRLSMEHQSAVRASFDLDGVKLVMASKGLCTAWPAFSRLKDIRLIDRLVEEASEFLHNDDFIRSVRRSEVGVVSGISNRHINLDVDSHFLHSWVAVFRSYGSRMLVDMTYEPCVPGESTGIVGIVRYDEIST